MYNIGSMWSYEKLWDDNNEKEIFFDNLNIKERKYVLNFFQEYFLEKWEFLIKSWDNVKNVYFLQKGQVLVTNDDWKGLWFLNPLSIVWASIIYDYSKKQKISNVNISTFQDCTFLIVPEDVIKNITDKDRNMFSKIIKHIKIEKSIFNQNIIL